jgi:hypothetical protein
MELKGTKAEDADGRWRIAVLQEKATQHSHVIAMLRDKVTQPCRHFGRLVGELSAPGSASAGIESNFGKCFLSEKANCAEV